MKGALDNIRFSKIHWRDVLPVAVLLTLTVFSIQYLYSFLRFPYPLEYREAASIILANALHQGSNPFALINYPQDMYIYGLLYPFFIAPWVGIVQPILLIPRLLDVIFLLLTCVLFFYILREKKATVFGSLAGSLILANAFCLVLKINGSRPDIPACFFSLSAVYLMMKRGTGFRWLILAVFGSLCSILLKSYLIIPVGLYVIHIFLFKSKRTGLLFLLLLAVFGAGTALVIRFAFPLYLREAVLHPWYISSGDFGHAWMQLITFVKWFAGLCVLYLVFLGTRIYQNRRSGTAKVAIQITSLDQPLLNGIQLDFFAWGFPAILALLLFSIGQNTGNSHSYFLELALPFLLCAVIPFLEQSIYRPEIRYAAYGFCLLSLIPLSNGYQTNFHQYSQAYQLVERRLESCSQIYAAPIMDLYLLNRGDAIYDNGLTEYGYTIINSRNPVLQKILGGNDGQIENRWSLWNQNLSDKVKTRAFDCIVVDSDAEQIGGIPLTEYYSPDTRFFDVLDWSVVTYNIRIDLTLWIPKIKE